MVSPNLCCVRAKDKHKSLCKFADNSFRPPQIFVEYEQKTKNGVYVNLQIIFHFQASPNLRRVLPHGEQRGPRQGLKMVVKHPRGQHAHGLAPVRGQSPLGFLHDLPVYCFFFNEMLVFANNQHEHCWIFLLFLFAHFAFCICCLSCLVGAGVHGGVPRDCSPLQEEPRGHRRRRQHHVDQPEERL